MVLLLSPQWTINTVKWIVIEWFCVCVCVFLSKSKGASDLCFVLNGVSHKVLQGQAVCIELFCLSPVWLLCQWCC